MKKAASIGFLLITVFCILLSGCGKNTEEITKTRFRTLVDEAAKSLSLAEGKIYVIDEKSYNEEEISFYMSVMAEKEINELSGTDVESFMGMAFSKKEYDGVVCLVKKDNRDLIMECGSMKKHNMLDRNLMGITHPSVDEKSRGFYISQNNPEFLSEPYGTSSVARSGCGPIALAMAINYVAKEERTTLSEVIDWTLENDLYVPGSGTKWTLMSAYPPVVGLKGREVFTSDFETFKSLFKEGSVIVTSMKKGHFTDNGHFIVLISEKDGKVSVLDPASITRTLEEWDTELIFSESKKGFYVISK